MVYMITEGFALVLLLMLFKVAVYLVSVNKIVSVRPVTIQMEVTEKYFPVMPFIMPSELVSNF